MAFFYFQKYIRVVVWFYKKILPITKRGRNNSIKNNFLKIELYRGKVLYSGYKVPITDTQKEF